jgi:hypothetical protein
MEFGDGLVSTNAGLGSVKSLTKRLYVSRECAACIEIPTGVRRGVGFLRQHASITSEDYIKVRILQRGSLAYHLRVFQRKGGKYEDLKKSTRCDRLGTVVAARNTYSDFAHFVPGPGLHLRTGRI